MGDNPCTGSEENYDARDFQKRNLIGPDNIGFIFNDGIQGTTLRSCLKILIFIKRSSEN